jgi:hypothetical protein
MLRLAIGIVLLAHGVGHSLGLLQAYKVATVNPAWDGGSWLLSGVAGSSITQLVGSVVWAASIVGFAALAAIVFGWLPAAWFAPLGIASAVISLVGVALFPMAFPTTGTIGAVVVDAAVLAAVAWLHWSPADLAA